MKKTLTLTLVFILLVLAVGLVVAQKEEKKPSAPDPQSPRKSDQKGLSAAEVTKLNSGPQKEYPEFTLAAQKEAMRTVEQMRSKTRIAGLRETIPPADWIEIAYHGLLVDANFDLIQMDQATVSKMLESMFSILYEPARENAIKEHGGDLKALFYEQKLQSRDQLVFRLSVLSSLLAQSDAKLQARYVWRYRLLRDAANAFVDPRLVITPEVAELMRQYRLRPDAFLPEPRSQYVKDCQAEGVPIPPNWPDSRWIRQGPLAFVFISASYTAEVFAYKDPAVSGVCYALPRTSGKSLQLLGIICQSNTTGKACFWDNVSADGVRLTGPDVNLDIQTVRNGSNLSETCTGCHRGYNVFNIHPGSALQLTRAGAIGGPYQTNPAVRYTPMGQAHWSNPGPLVLPAPPKGESSCLGCHELPQTSGSSYCSSVLRNAAVTTMPPFGKTRAGWTGLPINPEFASHIGQLVDCP